MTTTINNFFIILLLPFCVSTCSYKSQDLNQYLLNSEIVLLKTYDEDKVLHTSLQILEQGDSLINILSMELDRNVHVEYIFEKKNDIQRSKSIEGKDFRIDIYSEKSIITLDDKYWKIALNATDFERVFQGQNIGYFFDDFFGKGELIYCSYFICSSAVGLEIPYHVKKGKWKFWSKTYEKIGEGELEIFEEKIFTKNGEQKIKKNSLKLDTWNFSSSNKDEIENLINQLEEN